MEQTRPRRSTKRQKLEALWTEQAEAEALAIAGEARALSDGPGCLSREDQRPEIHVHDTHISYWEDMNLPHDDLKARDRYEHGIHIIFYVMLDMLRARGWRVERNTDRNLQGSVIAPWYFKLQKADLVGEADQGGRTFKFEFWQEARRPDLKDPSRARYERPCYKGMTPDVRLLFLVEAAAIVRFLGDRFGCHAFSRRTPQPAGHAVPLVLRVRYAVEDPLSDDPLAIFNGHWGGHGLERAPDGWPTEKAMACWQRPDRDGRKIVNGQMKYFRGLDGRLVRGRAWPNLNDMWFVLADGEYHQQSARSLFDCPRPDLEPRRVAWNADQRLRQELEKAVAGEHFERAIVLRDLIRRRGAKGTGE